MTGHVVELLTVIYWALLALVTEVGLIIGGLLYAAWRWSRS